MMLHRVKRLYMIIGIGIDMTENSRFSDWTPEQAQKIFTKTELEYAHCDKMHFEKHLANFWAVREATLKAIGTGFNNNISFSDISVTHDNFGKPIVYITGRAKEILTTIAGENPTIWVSITDQNNYSVAVVIIEKK